MTTSLRRFASIADRVQALTTGTTVLVAMLAGVGVVVFDVVTGPEISGSVFYVLPISIVAWRLGRWPGTAASGLSALAWFLVELTDGWVYSATLIPVWNTLVRLVFFIIITRLLVTLHDLVDEHAADARVDALTGLLNRRGFHERAEVEFERARRAGRPLTIVYFDIDGFKQLNDTAGHSAGDDALRTIGAAALGLVRQVDVVARMGGDEFVVLFPDTSTTDAPTTVERLRAGFRPISERAGIGFSIGVVTFELAPADVETATRRADDVMYAVKQHAKGTVRYETEPAPVI